MADTMLALDTRGTLEPLEVRMDRLLVKFWEKLDSRPSQPVHSPSTADLPPDSPPSPRHSPSLNQRKAHMRPHELRRRGVQSVHTNLAELHAGRQTETSGSRRKSQRS
ncbi:Hypothetical predicted protein [Pelobates cultripes]|uniref:Uncharacterized protein n=1 Tax=Pelobates cultripes TaxID=61616 RepID=A0AAD1VUL5_PELCU|nr:Hypothetical predicted protein [Pelobates cultripes]